MKLYRKGNKLKAFNESKLHILLAKKSKQEAYIGFLKNKINEIEQHIQAINLQMMLFDSSASFTRDEFFTNRRQKAALSLQLAQFEYERENLIKELSEKEDDLASLKINLIAIKTKCEKFQIFLKKKREKNNILKELRIEEELENIYVRRH